MSRVGDSAARSARPRAAPLGLLSAALERGQNLALERFCTWGPKQERLYAFSGGTCEFFQSGP